MKYVLTRILRAVRRFRYHFHMPVSEEDAGCSYRYAGYSTQVQKLLADYEIRALSEDFIQENDGDIFTLI
jgi:hypothetical protein